MKHIHTLNEYLSESKETELILYHGSSVLFDKFIIDNVGKEEANDADGSGIYFTNVKNDASLYGRYIYTVKLKPRKLISDKTRKGITRTFLSKLIKMRDDWELNAQDWDENENIGLNLFLNNVFDEDNAKEMLLSIWHDFYRYSPIEYCQNVTKLGVDGLISSLQWKDGVEHYIIYNPDIIEIIEIEEMNKKDGSLKKINENFNNKVFLGYHSSKKNLKEGYYKGELLDTSNYYDVIRNAYIDIISDYDENLENDDIEQMNDVFGEMGYGFTYVSEYPIEASSYQSSKYKYGDYLYKIYGDGNEILLDDANELQATIVVSKNPLYFEKID